MPSPRQPGQACRQPLIVGIGGTMRRGSATERALRLALRQAESCGASTELIAGPDLAFPPYDPDVGAGDERAQSFCARLRAADGVILASPCYHGSVSGLIKNALDYVEEMRSDTRPYFDGRAVGCIGCGAGLQGPSMVLNELRTIVHALRGWCSPLAVAINTAQVTLGEEGCSDGHIDRQIETMAGQVVDFALMMRLARDVPAAVPA
jgi:FMN reductase